MDVLLIHGMGRTPLSMWRLRRRLRRAGHRARLFGYSPTVETLEGATQRLVRRIARETGTAPYALAGHSLGTVLIRNALAQLEHPPAACFFLAPPMVACKAAKFFAPWWPYQRLMGEMGQRLACDAFMDALPMPQAPTRIYAGIAGPRASWLPFGLAANDGILSAAEASRGFESMTVWVPSLHTFIMHSRVVADDMLRVLATLKRG